MRPDDGLEIRLLGDLQVLRGGRLQSLPASKKTRALLGYLVATGTPHLRERLCDLLWEGPDDPRAALRWSLTKIRPLLNDAATPRLLADRDRVAFEARDTEIDAVRVRALLGSDLPVYHRGTEGSCWPVSRRVPGRTRSALLLPLPRLVHGRTGGAERDAARSARRARRAPRR